MRIFRRPNKNQKGFTTQDEIFPHAARKKRAFRANRAFLLHTFDVLLTFDPTSYVYDMPLWFRTLNIMLLEHELNIM
jgi:hypothetical protein